MDLSVIHQKIYELRGQKVMLDFDLATLYEVPTKVLNQAVKRNEKRFPEDFMFRLTAEEWGMLSQIVMASEGKGELVPQTSDNHTSEASVMRSHFVTASIQFGKRNKTHLPYAFTEHGVTMLASVLKSDKAIDMNIAIVRAFIALRQFALNYKDLADQVNEIRETVANHDEQLNKIYAAIEALSNEKKMEQQAWEERRRIGFER